MPSGVYLAHGAESRLAVPQADYVLPRNKWSLVLSSGPLPKAPRRVGAADGLVAPWRKFSREKVIRNN